jgi:FixJ family two-component response regulator
MIVAHPADQQVHLIDADDVVRDSAKGLLESRGMCVRDFCKAGQFLDSSKAAGQGLPGARLQPPHRRQPGTGGDAAPARHRAPGSFHRRRRYRHEMAAMAAGASACLERPVQEAALIRAVNTVTGYQDWACRMRNVPQKTTAGLAPRRERS